MSKSMDVIVGTGLDQKTRKSHWPARLDFVQSASGLPDDKRYGILWMGRDALSHAYDAAGALLNHLLGELNPPAAGEPAGSVLRLDLSAYFSEGSSVAGEGLVFVPQECAAEPAACRLHISFHGCRQSAELVGEEFVRSVGLNEWAAANRIVVIYPQVTQTMLNPQGCWDWWGYTGDDYDLASGKQVAGVAALISAFAGGKLLPAAAN